MANRQSGLCRSCVTIDPLVSSACNDSTEKLADPRAPSCFKVQKPSRTERSLRHGLLFPGRGPVVFPGCAARAVLKATLERGPTDGWTTGSNDVGNAKHSLAHNKGVVMHSSDGGLETTAPCSHQQLF